MPIKKENQRAKLYRLLGHLPLRDRKIEVEQVSLKSNRRYNIETLRLDLNGNEPVPAYFLTPKKGNPPFPTILYHHSHGGNYKLGKDELLKGQKNMAKPSYADALIEQNYAVMCIDSWCFGQRHHVSESHQFKEFLWKGQVLWGMMVYDALKSMDYLVSRPDVDSARIGTLGMSMGSTLAWWLAALDTRVKACVDICCLTDYETLMEEKGLDRHGLYYYVPDLINHFSTAQINDLISPRPHLALAGLKDPLTPAEGLKHIDQHLKIAYRRDNASTAWKLNTYQGGHQETPEMRKDILNFLEKWL